MIRNIFAFGLSMISFLIHGQEDIKYSELQLDSIYRESDGTFVLYDLQNDSYQIYNINRAKHAFAVHSTSKIFWSIIGLEENLIEETDIVKWDSLKYPRKEFWPIGFAQDQTITTALKYSVNWYYFEILRLMTPEMIEKYLNMFNYQKGFDVERINYFELTFNIRKSAFEQIDFLKNIYQNNFNLDEKTLEIVKKGITCEKDEDYILYAKTGTGPIQNDNGIGWLIGFIEKNSNMYFFAFNIEDKDEVKAGKLRNNYSVRVLKASDLIQ